MLGVDIGIFEGFYANDCFVKYRENMGDELFILGYL